MRIALRSVTLLASLACGCDTHDALTPPLGIFGGLGLGPGHFNYPRSVTAEPRGSVFVVDKTGRIQRFSRDGAFERFWSMPETEHGKPTGLKVHPDGRIFVADTHYSRVMIFDRDGKALGSFGSEGNELGQFQLPTDVAFDKDGNIYVGEYRSNDRITKWSPDLVPLAVIGEAPIAGARLSRPAGLDFDDENTLWVADACNHRIVRFDTGGAVLTVFGSFGSEPGQMRYPYDVSVSPKGEIMVCEYGGHRLQWFSKDGRSLRTWGKNGRAAGELFAPWSASYGPDGHVYVVDSLNNRVQIVAP